MSQKRVSAAFKIFGGQVRFHRKRLALTQGELGDRVGQSAALIHAIECGRRPALSPLLEQLDEELQAGGALVVAAEGLVGVPVAEFFADVADWEAECVSVDSFENSVLPGLLQTPDYARAVLKAGCPPLSDDEIEQQVSGRIDRQDLLTRQPTVLCGYVIEEWVLRRPIGGEAVLKAQLERLMEYMAMRNVSIQIMKTRTVEHVGLDGPMLLLDMPTGVQYAYIPHQAGGTAITDPEQVRSLRQRYGIIRAQASSTTASLALVKQIAGEL